MLDTLKECDVIAKKIIRSSFSHSAKWILRDSEFIGEAVNELIIADKEWNGKGTLYGYRKQRVKWKILALIKKRKREFAIPLSTPITEELFLYDILEAKDMGANVEKNDLLRILNKHIDKSTVLSPREKDCILLRLSNLTLKDIGKQLTITKEAVRQNIKRGLNKIKI